MAETERDTVLRVVATQAPDYLIHPDAAAFQAEGLDPDTVRGILDALVKDGHVREDEVVLQTYKTEPVMLEQVDANGNVVTVQMQDDQGRPVARKVLDASGEPILTDALDANGNPVVLDVGWCVTSAGLKRHVANLKKAKAPARRERKSGGG